MNELLPTCTTPIMDGDDILLGRCFSDILDFGAKGFIELDDFKKINANLSLDDDTLEMTFRELDTDDDGRIDYADFENGLKKAYYHLNFTNSNRRSSRHCNGSAPGEEFSSSPSSYEEGEENENFDSPNDFGNFVDACKIARDTARSRRTRRVCRKALFANENNLKKDTGDCKECVMEDCGSQDYVPTGGGGRREDGVEVYECDPLHTAWYQSATCRSNAADLDQSSHEKVCDLYQHLHKSGNTDALQKFESVILGVVMDTRKHKLENRQLEELFQREKDSNERHLRQIESEFDSEVQNARACVRIKEKEKFERDLDELRAQFQREAEMAETNFAKQLEDSDSDKNTCDDCGSLPNKYAVELATKLDAVQRESRLVKSELTDARENLDILRSEVTELRRDLNYKCAEISSTKQAVVSFDQGQSSFVSQLLVMRDTNKNLFDINDVLREALAESTRQRTCCTPALANTPARISTPLAPPSVRRWNQQKRSRPKTPKKKCYSKPVVYQPKLSASPLNLFLGFLYVLFCVLLRIVKLLPSK